ncbi:MAG TPA: aspartate/glutamate racemase family protein [Nitrospiraceae bacterium]|nr:aspartate/glutamate racemase family protein [Nitrospiraceae bacterium]
MKIWYQSFVDPIQQGDYFRDLSQVLAATADPGVQYDVHGILPPDLELHRLTEFRCSAQVIRNAVSAEQEGYDAFAIGHFQDGGLYESRAAVDIPVLALGEASMLFASTLGRKIALVTINPVFIPMHEEQVARYGLRERIVEVRAVMTNPRELVWAFTDAASFDRVLRQFREQVQPLVEAGVEVVIPAGGLPALLFSRLKDFTVGNAVVLNCIAVLAKMTELAVKLRRLNGTSVSRASTFVKPSEKALREFLDSCASSDRP